MNSERVERTLALLRRIRVSGSDPGFGTAPAGLAESEYIAIGIAALETMLLGPSAQAALQDWSRAYASDYAAAVRRRLTVRWRGHVEARLELYGVEKAVLALDHEGWTLTRCEGFSGAWVEWVGPPSLDPETVYRSVEEALARLAFSLAWEACGQAGA